MMPEELTRRGYCTYTFNLNGVPHSSFISLTGDMRESAKGLGAFITMVLARTHTDKVDLVGWSQGAGPLPNQYLKFENGASGVDHFIGLVPSNHGTTAYGLNLFLNSTTSKLGAHFDDSMALLNGMSAPQQLQGSDFNKTLYDTPVTQPGVKYTIITSTHDHVVVPYTNAYLHEPGGEERVAAEHLSDRQDWPRQHHLRPQRHPNGRQRTRFGSCARCPVHTHEIHRMTAPKRSEPLTRR